ncbi:MAG: ORF6N domain-containing protein [Bacteroidota bacterium]
MRKSYAVDTHIETFIVDLRGEKVILDVDLARVYGVTTKALNQAVKRNVDRFPPDFLIQLTRSEWLSLRSQIVTSKRRRGGRRYLPFAFTEHGAVMAATVLNSERAVQMSLFVVRAFLKMRRAMAGNGTLLKKLKELEKRLTRRLDSHEQAIVYVLSELRKLMEPTQLPEPRRRPIGFRQENDEES